MTPGQNPPLPYRGERGWFRPGGGQGSPRPHSTVPNSRSFIRFGTLVHFSGSDALPPSPLEGAGPQGWREGGYRERRIEGGSPPSGDVRLAAPPEGAPCCAGSEGRAGVPLPFPLPLPVRLKAMWGVGEEVGNGLEGGGGEEGGRRPVPYLAAGAGLGVGFWGGVILPAPKNRGTTRTSRAASEGGQAQEGGGGLARPSALWGASGGGWRRKRHEPASPRMPRVRCQPPPRGSARVRDWSRT